MTMRAYIVTIVETVTLKVTVTALNEEDAREAAVAERDSKADFFSCDDLEITDVEEIDLHEGERDAS